MAPTGSTFQSTLCCLNDNYLEKMNITVIGNVMVILIHVKKIYEKVNTSLQFINCIPFFSTFSYDSVDFVFYHRPRKETKRWQDRQQK